MGAPSIRALETAAEWLTMYEGEIGDQGEAAEVHAVADWLRERADAKMKREVTTLAIQKIAREKGVAPSVIRDVLRRKVATADAPAVSGDGK